MSNELAKTDDESVRAVLSSPPFVPVEGVVNFRDFGGLPVTSLTSATATIKPKYLYRSGDPSRISEGGKEALRALGVAKVFDLRSKSEIESYKSATPGIEGVEIVHCPLSDKEHYDPVALAQRLQSFHVDEKEAFAKLYAEILESGGPAYATILKHLRDEPEKPCLIHCTAGKDRTGIFAAVVQKLLGARDEDIIADYHLTTIGLQPLIPLLTARFLAQETYRDNWQGFLNMGSAKRETMQETLRMIDGKYGGVEGYIKTWTKLTDEDIEKIRKNLIVSRAQL